MKKTIKRPFNIYQNAPLLIIGLVIFAGVIVALTSLIVSARSYATPEKTWESYLDAINDDDIAGYAKAFFKPGTDEYDALLRNEGVIYEINLIKDARTISFVYNQEYAVDELVNRIAEISFVYTINEEPYSMTMTIIFFHQNGRWYMQLPE
jgi:hypothetical protein